MLSKAIALASALFEGKYDQGGKPYILHCLYVMYKLGPDDEDLMIIGVLHDVVEDTHITIQDLREMGFSERVLAALELLTHRAGVPYMDYIKTLATNEDCKKVKRADLDHNSRILRMKGLRKKDFERLEKYFTAYEYLKD